MAPPPKADEDKHWYKLRTKRRRLRKLGDTCLGAATNNPGVQMRWGYSRHRTPKGKKVQKCVLLFNTKLVGIPRDIKEFKAPGKISRIADLDKMIAAFEDGTMYFENVSSRRVARLVRRHRLQDDEAYAVRSDAGKVRDVRPPPTRSKHLRKGTKNKTRPVVTDEVDARIDREFAENMAVWVSEGRAVEAPFGRVAAAVAAAAAAADEPEDEIEEWSSDGEVVLTDSDIEDADGEW